MADITLTPVNTISREELSVLITNHRLNSSIEFLSDCEMMETDSPVRKHKGMPISKKLFHSPIQDSPNQGTVIKTSTERSRRAKKRKLSLMADSDQIQPVYIKECDKEGYSPNPLGGIRKKVLMSLFQNKEYSMEMCG